MADSRQIDAHLRSRANPHTVEATQTGAYRRDGDLPLTAALNAESLTSLLQNATAQSTPPTGSVGLIYLDDGTNTFSLNEGFRICTATGPDVWDDLGLKIVAGNGISLALTVDEEHQIAVDESGVDHNSLNNLTTGDPHTQYAQVAGDTFTGDVTLNGGNLLQTAAETLFGVDLSTDVPAMILGVQKTNAKIEGGLATFSGTTSLSVTTTVTYGGPATYFPFAVKRHTTGSIYVLGTKATAANAFTIYMSASYTGNVYWLTIGY